MQYLYDACAWVMKLCYDICLNYGLAILLFTLLSKIILLPISIYVQKNSIKMVKMQPEINFMKVKFFGDRDSIAEEQTRIFKKEKYHPMVTLIPVVIQLILLMAVIAAIRSGMTDKSIDMSFIGINLSKVPSESSAWFIFSPIAAGLSAYLMCVAQNVSNVLQAEQSKLNKYGTLALSVGLSLYLGWFVPVGVALYWVASNLFAIVQLYALNWAINPKKYVDYEKLEKSKEALSNLEHIDDAAKKSHGKEAAKRERADYKSFFKTINKHLVFYSESSGFYKYFRGIIEYILKNTNINVHYVTSDPDDAIFELAKKEPKIHPYYIGEKKLITLMMKMDADVVVMTMPDIENYHIKRSYIRKDIDYVFIPHGVDSINAEMRTGCVDHYDTILVTGKHQREEVEKTEIAYNLPKKRIIDWGYTLIDDMRRDYKALPHKENDKKMILIAPSWQKDNIIDSCLEKILNELGDKGYRIVVRPHPQQVRHKRDYFETLKEKYASNPDIEIQTDFSSDFTVFSADLLISDWSAITYEYAYTTQKPVLFINTPMKIMNPEYKRIDTVPINIWLRDEIGCSLDPDKLDGISEAVERLFREKDSYYDKIGKFVSEYNYNLGNSAEVGAKYIIGSIKKKADERKQVK